MNKYDHDIEQLDADYQKKRNELKNLSNKSKQCGIPEEEQELAEFLHNKLCKYNHIDECGWFYDQGDWTEYSRKEYLEKTRKVLKITTFDDAINICNALNN